MLYHFLAPLASDFSAFNVFRYITFRSMGALITAMVISVLIGPAFISFLHRIKVGQYILSDVKAHAAKAGTPTMGGLMIMLCVFATILLWADLGSRYIWQTMLVFGGFGIIGFWDDMTKLRQHQNKGISPRAKMGGLVVIASLAMYLLYTDPGYTSKLYIPFAKGWAPDLGILYLPFGVFLMVASSNAVNLTDGLDGLAIGPTVMAGLVFAIFIYITGNAKLTQYLYLPYIPGVGEVTVFCGAFIGAGLGFLWFNAYPAQVFMGDVGSLSLGGTLGFLALLCKQELILAVVGGLFVAETLSVIVQVSYFKWTGGKRFFRMAPLHHHFELKGIPESKIIIRFWITSIILGLVALSTLKLR
ncbi:MAG: phospho-N-acetylmuramoyl-pentapeptide-transferase [Desulfovibrio sp.]|jgi:phospho-N-acetylmuramoyl-pentapeptide-transferase|nr:phospho-N-acetylmuramoyl-pentapeptide-transferase [Desulfovibrio sp.]MBQ4124739.1 phospho-N-acetylmuramoyl-pentapeptide-transferase [Desulfovibrio sp.]